MIAGEKNQKMCDIDVSGGVVDKISLVAEDDYFVLSKSARHSPF